MKRKTVVAVSLAFLLLLGGCAGIDTMDEKPERWPEVSRSGEASAQTEEGSSAEPAGQEETDLRETEAEQPESDAGLPKPAEEPVAAREIDDLNRLKTRHVYSDIMTQLVAGFQLPDPETDGIIRVESEDLFNGIFSMEENLFAVCDVDGDGGEELIVCYTTAPMAGMMELVYGYDPEQDKLSLEMLDFPAIVFYDNGTAIVQASHNHSYCAEQWPCSLYQYQAQTGTYELVACYSAWSREEYPSISIDGESVPFPEELDRDGDGILYSIRASVSDADHFRYDRAEFEAWLAECLSGAQEILPEYHPANGEYFLDFTREYLQTLYTRQDGVERGTDIGWMYHETWIGEVYEYIGEHYDVALKWDEDADMMLYGYQDGQQVFGFVVEDGGCLMYYDRQVEDITLFGVCPGMDLKTARKILTAYGFYDRPDEFSEEERAEGDILSMITGTGLGNIGIYAEADASGRITYISQFYYCEYTG